MTDEKAAAIAAKLWPALPMARHYPDKTNGGTFYEVGYFRSERLRDENCAVSVGAGWSWEEAFNMLPHNLRQQAMKEMV